jgi:type IX secretion system PorP/SprF family membrane protein
VKRKVIVNTSVEQPCSASLIRGFVLLVFFLGSFAGKRGGSSLYAQDPHFSQFFYAPLTTNPANTGVFNGDVRVATLYRMQWFTVTNPYKTASVSLDAPLFRSRMNRNDFFSGGFNVINDGHGSANITTSTYNALISYTKYLGGKKSNYLTFGYTAGYGMRTAGLDGLKYESQYDPNTGGYSSAYGINEQNSGTTAFIDMSTGLLWSFSSDRKLRNSLGVSVHHLTAPNISILGRTDKLLRKYSFQWNAAYKLGNNSNAELLPAFLFAKQGNALLINAGANVKYLLQERSRYTNYHNERSMSVGLFYRFRDAAYLNLRLDFEDFAFAAAYDINISGLTPASRTIGGFEFMLQYRGAFGFKQNTKRASTQFL